MIEIRNLRSGSFHIGLLDLPRGITTVIGRNGSGKTTLLRLCAGILTPDTGSILIDGKPPRQTDIGWINEFPDRNMLFSNVMDEISSSLWFRYSPPDDTDYSVQKIACRLELQKLLSRQIRSLSGGEKVLVALATALVSEPEMIILDEYDSHLDERRCMQIERILSESGCHYILRCTQQMDTAADSDYVVMLDNGRPVYNGRPQDVFPNLTTTLFYPLSWRAEL